MLVAVSVYNLLLILAIVFLEWHYFVDIIAGIAVAAIAIVAVARDTPVQNRDQSPQSGVVLAAAE